MQSICANFVPLFVRNAHRNVKPLKTTIAPNALLNAKNVRKNASPCNSLRRNNRLHMINFYKFMKGPTHCLEWFCLVGAPSTLKFYAAPMLLSSFVPLYQDFLSSLPSFISKTYICKTVTNLLLFNHPKKINTKEVADMCCAQMLNYIYKCFGCCHFCG